MRRRILIISLFIIYNSSFLVMFVAGMNDARGADYGGQGFPASAAFMNNTRIYNGDIFERKGFMVAIMILDNNNNGQLSCGGSVINDEWILTAGHCIDDNFERLIINGRVQAWVGAYDVSVPESSNIRQQITVVGVRQPPMRWNQRTQLNDIALLKLGRRIDYGNNFESVRLRGGSNYLGAVRLIGWGRRDCVHTARKLQSATGQTITNNACQRSYNNQNIAQSMICAVLASSNGYAQQAKGDSGGPLFYYDRNLGSFVQVGIVSFDRKYDNGCPDNRYPGVYTRVSSFISWIQSEAGNIATA